MTQNFYALSSKLQGTLTLPGDPDYDEARAVYNAMHDRRPAGIVKALDVSDIVATVNFAREQGLLLAIRGGAHSVPGFGTCDDGLVLDLGNMNEATVDTASKTVHVQPGSTLADMDKATHEFGLAVPGGTVSSTGVAGLTLGGGMGHLSRSCGLSCDNLLRAQVVTANGEILNCSSQENTNLFWAIRGGGGNFGVVTSFTFKAFPIETIYGGPTMFRIDGDVMRYYTAPVIMSAKMKPPLPTAIPTCLQ